MALPAPGFPVRVGSANSGTHSMHTPTPADDRLCSERSGGDAGFSSGVENQGSAETRRGLKESRRKHGGSGTTVDTAYKRNAHPTKIPRGWMDGLAEFLVRNQIRMSLTLMCMLAATHMLFSELRLWVQKFYVPQYYNAKTGLYGIGPDDGYLIAFWIVLFTFLRSAVLDYILVPLARRGGIVTRKGVVRFSEQAWLVVYYIPIWGIGMYLMYNGPYWFDLEQLWTDWPVREIRGLFKWYYLAQIAFWLQQIFVLFIEERRKDHWQMFAHHIITCILLAASYLYHMMRVGHVILCIMDVIDILLSGAKLLKYLGYNTICDVAFGVFLVAWVIGRHGLYNRVVYSVWQDSIRIIEPGCYPANSPYIPVSYENDTLWGFFGSFSRESEAMCWTRTIQGAFLFFLVVLQIITLAWLYMILRVAWRVVQGVGADDTRSDDEDEDDGYLSLDEISKHPLDESGSPEKIAKVVGANGSIKPAILTSHSRSHMSSQPLGGD